VSNCNTLQPNQGRDGKNKNCNVVKCQQKYEANPAASLDIEGLSLLRPRESKQAIQLLRVSQEFCTADVFRFQTCVQALQNRLISEIVKHCDKRAHIIPVALICLQVYFRNTSGKYNV
jgi:hypothetical protein